MTPLAAARRPRIRPAFFKAHGHGNDYLVFDEGPGPLLAPQLVRRICDRHRGPGADGIVVLESAAPEAPDADFALRMFNPDGGEFERSGNGLRIAAAYLRRTGRAGRGWFGVRVGGGRARLRAGPLGADGARDAHAEMGKATFPNAPPFVAQGSADSRGRVALSLPSPSGEPVRAEAVPVSVGNPHAVVFADSWTQDDVERWGPLISASPAFPQGANVQFAERPGRGGAGAAGGRGASPGPQRGARPKIAIRIWERGVGPTSASGTSACAAAAAAMRLGLLPRGPATVKMPGGDMEVEIAPDWSALLRGPVEEVCAGELAAGFLAGRAS